MQGIVNCAKIVDAKATFARLYLNDSALGSILSTTSALLTATRTLLSRLDSVEGEGHERKNTELKKTCEAESKFHSDDGNFSKNGTKKCNFERIELEWKKNKNSGFFEIAWARRSFPHEEAVGITVAMEHFGEGAERIVYEMSEINSKGELIGLPLLRKTVC
jgi:hypothetical protein